MEFVCLFMFVWLAFQLLHVNLCIYSLMSRQPNHPRVALFISAVAAVSPMLTLFAIPAFLVPVLDPSWMADGALFEFLLFGNAGSIVVSFVAFIAALGPNSNSTIAFCVFNGTCGAIAATIAAFIFLAASFGG